MAKPPNHAFEFHPVTAERWADLALLFEAHANPNYCWCMRWRLKSTEFQKQKAADRKAGLAATVAAGTPVGVLAYLQGEPVGWCSVAPRETYTLLERSSTLKRVDDQPVWSVVCFFVKPSMRGQKLAVGLLRAAVDYAIAQGANIVEGYPVEPDQSYRFMGSPALFAEVGFREAAIAKNGRSIVRLVVSKQT